MPARLACVKPAASVRSEPGSNSQVGLETSNRLITTFLTRSHHFLSAEANKLSAIHIADNDGVTFKTCTAEVFRPAPKDENRSFQLFETRKDSAVHVSLSSSSLVKQPGIRRTHLPLKGALQTHSTTNNNRLLSAVDSLIVMRSIRGTTTRVGQEPKQRRAQWPGYRPARSGLSTPVVNKSSHPPRESCAARKSLFLGTLRRT
jgi:hypothetical protein